MNGWLPLWYHSLPCPNLMLDKPKINWRSTQVQHDTIKWTETYKTKWTLQHTLLKIYGKLPKWKSRLKTTQKFSMMWISITPFSSEGWFFKLYILSCRKKKWWISLTGHHNSVIKSCKNAARNEHKLKTISYQYNEITTLSIEISKNHINMIVNVRTSSLNIFHLQDSSVVFSSLVFHSSFMQCYPLGSSNLVGRVLSIGLYLFTFIAFSSRELICLLLLLLKFLYFVINHFHLSVISISSIFQIISLNIDFSLFPQW